VAQVNKSTKGKGQEHEKTSNLRGTLASVLILGGILLVCWLTVFIIYMVRNGG